MVLLINFNRLKLITYIVIYYIYAIYIVRFKDFKHIAYNLEKKSINKLSIYDPNYIFGYERKVAKLFRIKKCLISSICLFYLFKNFGLKCRLCIGVSKLNGFASHAWIETENVTFLKDAADGYKIIRKF